ncbi:S8 family serine peptidase [Flavobacteriaceae bacterium]|nr:S8 family serine peptidase [Flavobacteriaceae bacterium]
MKKLIILLSFSSFVIAQTPAVVQQDLMNFEPGELIVKLKDNVDAGVYYEANGKAMSNFNIGELLGIEEKVASSKVMFHQNSIESSIQNQKRLAAQYAAQAAANPNNGYQPEPPRSMKNVFVITTTNEQENIPMLVEELNKNSNVDYAEPNYIYGIDDFEIGETITAEQASKMTSSNSSSTIEVDDPLYSSQSNITATNIDDVWDQYTTGDGSQVIAILDTGGDYTHPDLEANTWINEAEFNGVEGYDDDGNGYVDDIRGWDFINIDNAPLDDNMHGTHVAGIAGAVGNNGIGIAGAAWDVKLMHIKVFQSTGQGNSTTIAEGVEYAYMNGATILNMSFGSYAESSTLRLALENAYSTSTLVAAAGNNGIRIGPCPIYCFPMYPAAYNYVIGVKTNTLWSNQDFDGPISTGWTIRLLNYELDAPATGIMSTIPGGGYAPLTGTSMATPLVAGGVALYKEQKPDDSGEILMGSLINTAGSPFVDILTAIETEPTPKLSVITSTQRDTINGQNGNGYWEPGETIEILPLVKNYWGPTEDVRVGIEFAEFEDTSKATIVQDEIQIGSISAYASLQDLYETLKITIAEGVANNVDIRFNLTAWSGTDQEYMSEPTEIVVNVKNSILLEGMISNDMTLSPDKEYLVVNNVIVNNNAVMTIEPGTILKFSDGKRITFTENSKLVCNGTPENRIKLIAENLGWKGVFLSSDPPNDEWHTISFTEFKGLNITAYGFLSNSYKFLLEDSLFFDNFIIYNFTNCYNNDCLIRRVNYYDNTSFYNTFYDTNFLSGLPSSNDLYPYENIETNNSTYGYQQKIYDINYIGNNDISASESSLEDHLIINGNSNTPIFPRLNAFNNPLIGNNYQIQDLTITAGWQGSDALTVKPLLYIGSSVEEIMDSRTRNYLNNDYASYALDWSDAATVPFEGAHGIVWKVEVNGYDAQDEYALLDPIGVGEHEFKVYFNRAMDTSVDPQISYGVSIPFTQNLISEEGTWSSDGKTYTVLHTIRIGAADGINRIRVQGARDLDLFDIPVEDTRFNMLVQSAGSASTGFFATPGLGKIALEWAAPSTDALDDVLGYNMYRYQVDADGNEGDPTKLNESLIIEDTDESTTGVYFTDYDVLEGQTYFYKYKILRTSFEETDYSNTVSSAPLTSTLGDSNGDFDVNVLDLVHDVDYILGNNPEPFIFVAGDVNADNTINVLDIVGTVDIILNGDDGDVGGNSMDINFYPSEPIGYADFSWDGNDLYVESMHSIGGLQLAFDADFEYVLHDLPGVERLDYTQDESKVLMLYSFNNTAIASTRTKLLTRLDSTKEIDIDLAVAGTTTGAKLTPRFKGGELDGIESPFQSNGLEFLKLFPNPSNGEVTLEYYLPKNMDGAVAKVYDMVGRLVWIQAIEREEGMQQTDLNLNSLQKGNYVVIISAGNNSGEQLINHKLLMLK